MQVRQCDTKARELLGPQGQTRVFLTPPRECLNEVCPEDFQKCHRNCRDKGAGLPVWGILKKIKEVDELMTPRIQERIIEFHPELAWWRTAGRVLDSKHQQTGLSQRKEILEKHILGLDELLSWKQRLGSAAKLDDLLDALIGLSVAERVRAKAGRFLPVRTESDIRGLTMQIWY
jgi:predicted RNase H-like nuclease